MVESSLIVFFGEVMKALNKYGIAALGVAFILAGCSSSSKVAVDASPSVSATPTPTPTPTWPLTGMESKAASATKPVVVIKVENDPMIRPQAGLESADIIFEELVEGGITRFAAIFQSKFPKEIGPVRSVRHVDVAIAAPVADFFVFSGGARPTITYVRGNAGKGVYILTEGAPGMYRTNYHPAPHNLFISPLSLIKSMKKTKTPSQPMFMAGTRTVAKTPSAPTPAVTESGSASPSSSAKPVPDVAAKLITKVNLRFSNSENPAWAWSKSLGKWVRSEGSVPAFARSGARLSATNVVVLKVKTQDAGYRDPAGNFVPRTMLQGTGKGWLMVDHKQLPVTWSKPELKSPFTFIDAAGNSVSLKPGNTWVELIPLGEGDAKFTYVKSKKESASPKS